MTKQEAKEEIVRIVNEELPRVKTMIRKDGVIVKKTRADEILSKKLSKRISKLMEIIEALGE